MSLRPAVDGEVVVLGSERYFELMPPNKACLGNRGAKDACRCVYLYRFAGAK